MTRGLRDKIRNRLLKIYEEEKKAEDALEKIDKALSAYKPSEEKRHPLSQEDIILITYGDTLVQEKRPGFQTLSEFLQTYVGNAVNTVHILPMYPYTSDGLHNIN